MSEAAKQQVGESAIGDLPNKELLARNNAIPAPPGVGDPKGFRKPLGSDTTGENDFNAQDGLSALMAVDHPALGGDQPITYTLTYANRGTGTATGLYADVVTWGPMRLPDGIPLSDEYGQYDWLLLPLGDLAPGERMTAIFRGHTDFSYDPGNHNGWATLDIVVYDDTGSVYNNQLDWLYLDYEYDDQPPAVGITALPAILGPGENAVNGFAFDQSAVPTVTLAVEGGQTWDCQDDTPDDGTWSCAWDVGDANEGAVFRLRARATDEHGQVGTWTNWQAFTVDAIPPTITLGVATEAALYDGLLGPSETTLSGQLSDNRLVGAVEAYSPSPSQGEGRGGGESTDLLVDATTLPQNTFTYEDVPETPIAIGAQTACYGGTEIFRTFTVTDSFTVADVDLALNVDHEYRYDVTGWLVAPSGAWAAILWDGTSADNYDVRLSDAALFANGKDRTDHDTDAPYYENERRPDQPLSLFNGEQAAGDWQLILCDYFPEKDDGAYNRSQLILTADTLPENTEATWSYPLPDVENSDDVTHTLSLYGLDSVGNRSTDPLTLTFRVDTVAPVITVTHRPSETLILNETFDIYIAGSVSDGGEVASTQLRILAPNGDFQSLHLYPTGGTWAFTDTYYFVRPGFYSIWIEAVDEAGNVGSVGPFETRVSVPQFVHLPLVMRNHTYTCQDIYKPDDDSAQASTIATDGASQRHNLFPAGDVDWVVFDVEDASVDYVIETFDLSPSADTIIYLYDSDGEWLLDWNDDAGSGTVASYLSFNPYHTGTFFVKVAHYDPEVGGCDVEYSISVAAQPRASRSTSAQTSEVLCGPCTAGMYCKYGVVDNP